MRFHNIPVRDIMQEAVRYGGVIVDVRTEEEFLRGHIPMAVNVPLSEVSNFTMLGAIMSRKDFKDSVSASVCFFLLKILIPSPP